MRRMLRCRFLQAAVLVGLLLALALTVCAQEEARPGLSNAVCPDAELLGPKLITDICWSCLFPLRIAGVPIGGGSVPSGASDQALCACTDPAGLPSPGVVIGMWEPARIVELVRVPGCMPSLGGARLDLGRFRTLGTPGQAEYDGSDKAFYNYHYYAFPVLVILDLFFPDRCNVDHLTDFDVLYLSELDPTWNNDELAFFTNPEAAFVANPIAQAACLVDAASATTVQQPLDTLFWCAGAWGGLYPFTGRIPTLNGRPSEMSLASARVLAALHRRGLARQTVGDAALCEAPFALMLPKTQYRLSQFYPLPEANSNHVIGESELRWGMWRNVPGVGEDHLYLIWRWHDCCLTWL
ncbi:TraU family protein [Thiorhodococcus drewsii AZ1]|uniref:TraU family protein n=1 Tax=Thiorhodococcus drewsii AZ1 TaxID=765913 RepID=G2DYQ5_9GAMM|nr:TraU family protein [Thiorhodococcus drewsii]EGV32682.1 TraU family protein [Thiorhodococcus drewsii AZ1]